MAATRPPPGQPAGGYPPAPGQQPPPGYPNQPGYGQPPGGGPNPGQRIQQLALSPQDWMLLGATVAMLLGLILDWYSERGFDANGFDDGVFPLSLGFLVAAIIGGIPIVLRLAKSSMPPFMGIGSREAEGVLGILMILGGLAWLIYDPAGAGVDKAIGLWLTILAAFVWGAGAIWRNFAPSTPPGAGGPTPGPGYGGY